MAYNRLGAFFIEMSMFELTLGGIALSLYFTLYFILYTSGNGYPSMSPSSPAIRVIAAYILTGLIFFTLGYCFI